MDVSPLDLQKALAGAKYPATKGDLLAHASTNGAPEDVTRALNAVPDRRYDGPDAISRAVGESG